MVSIKDVAKQAGVAISTVSKVLNHYPNVSEATREKVNKAIAELGFVPNSIASALSSKQSGRCALLVNMPNKTQAIDEIHMQYIAGAIHQAMEMNMDLITVFFSMLKDKTVEEIIRYFQSQNIAGIIIYGISKEDKVLQHLIERQAFKIVVVDAPIRNAKTSSIWIDNEQAQYEVAKKTVLENGADSVLYISGGREGYVAEERLKGIKRLAKDLKLGLLVRNGEYSELTARNLTFKYAKKKGAVVCASDLMAIGAMKALIEMDIYRPVCGFDGITLMGYVGRQMNTVSQNFFHISTEAVKELSRLLAGEEGKNIVLDFELARLKYMDIIC